MAAKYILAVDIERTGYDFTYGIWAIGACFGNENGTILERATFAVEMRDEVDFDSVTWKEFWSALPEIRQLINSRANKNAPSHIAAFHAWLVALEKSYGPFGRKHKGTVALSLASDNPAYDFGHIMVAFQKEGFSRGVAEMFDDYVPTDDPTEQEAGLTAEERAVVAKYITCAHSHEPSEQKYRRSRVVLLFRRPPASAGSVPPIYSPSGEVLVFDRIEEG